MSQTAPDFSSDTAAPTHPAVLEALAEANSGNAASYGDDDLSAALSQTLADLFETEIACLPVVSGTAANALALSILCPPTSAVLCHAGAHVAVDERGAPEFFTGGGRLFPLPGPQGKIKPETLKAALARRNPGFVHETPADVLSLTNLTENGSVYSPVETAKLAGMAKEHGLSVHLDGARLANALVGLKSSPAEITWRAGVDVLTLGLTKTGAIGCEIIVLFGETREKFPDLLARAKRAGHLPPKQRFIAAQALALLDQGLWLDLAARANKSATRLSDMLAGVPGASIVQPVHGNEVFAKLPEALVQRLQEAGVGFYPWPDGSYRFVCSWATDEDALGGLRALIRSVTA